VRFWASVRRSLERTGGSLAGSVTVDLGDDSARLVGGLLGVRLHPGRRRLALRLLDERLRTSAAGRGLESVVTIVTGAPLRDRPSERAGRLAEWDAVWAGLDDLLVTLGLGAAVWVASWSAWLRRGILARAGAGRAGEALGIAVPAVAAVMRPSETGASVGPSGERQLGELATSVAGDAHALDADHLAGALVVRALSLVLDLPPPASSAERRALWAAAGVATDQVSGTVLAWNLRPPGTDRWAAMMRERASLGLVTALTAVEVQRAVDGRLHDDVVHAVENPQVLQAATVAGVPRALVCFSGNPSVAGWGVARSLGEQLRYHGDFDWPGVAIAGRLFAIGAQPWRFSARDYLTAIAATGASLPLSDRAVDTPWDPTLADEMRQAGLAVHEEALTALLLADLR
jgi:uncharacterized protein (TIGR02679 family)